MSGARRVLLRVLALVAVALAAVALALGGGAARARRSDAFCVSCHAAPAAHRPGHRGVGCQRCHASAERGGIGLVLASAGIGAAPAHGATRASSCVDCHRRDESRWRSLTANPEHRRHLGALGEASCVRCHAGSLHERPTAREGCRQCHAATPMRAEPRSEGACASCHAFSSRPMDRARQVPSATPNAVTAAHVHGAADCRGCHDPHREDDAAAQARRVDCVRCHTGRHAQEVAAGPEGHRDCLGCHQPHARRDAPTSDCARCHAAPRDNAPREVLQGAPRRWPLHPTDPAGAFVPPPNASPEGLHDGRCATCHRPHTWTARREDCRGCHTEQATTIARVPAAPHQDCVSCHAPHGGRPTADTCRGCHDGSEHRATAGVPERHRDCLSCHQPHGGRAEATDACARCHEATAHALHAGPEAHGDCRACHQPHGPPAAPSRASCARCHGAQGVRPVATPQALGHQRCDGCHARHAFERAAATRACATCHRVAMTNVGAHRGDCTNCHAPHDPARDRAGNCAGCHPSVHAQGSPRAVAGHARCNQCHAPHRDDAEARARCASCHARQAQVAQSWSGRGPHGGECATCHAPHRAGGTTACASCHAAQNNRAHTGNHAQCATCHAPHEARPGSADGGWWSRCASCHTAQATAAATAAGAHRRCADCHDRPGRVAPSCATCHAAMQGTLLHGNRGHQRCASCHATHGTPSPTRAQCLTCHNDRAQHFADAPRCQSCHPFAQPR